MLDTRVRSEGAGVPLAAPPETTAGALEPSFPLPRGSASWADLGSIDATARVMREILRAAWVEIWLCDDASGGVRLATRVSDGDTSPDGAGQLSEQSCWGVLRSRRLSVNENWRGPADSPEGDRGQTLFAPFYERDHPLGLVAARSAPGHEFGAEALHTVETITAHMSVAVKADRARAEAQRQASHLHAILDVNKRLSLGPPLEEVLSRITEEAARLLGMEAAGLRLVVGDELVRVAVYGLAATVGTEISLRIGEGLSGLVAAENRPIVSSNMARDPRLGATHRAEARRGGLRGWLGVPLRSRSRVVGVVCVFDRVRRRFSQADIHLLEAFADQAEIAIERTQLYEELAEREQQMRDLVGRLLLAQEEERRHVAFDLHDGLAQLATAAHQHLEAYAAKARPRSARGRFELALARDLMQRTVGEARRLIAGLRPIVLEDLGLEAAITQELSVLRDEGWEIVFQQELHGGRLPAPIETALFRVVQEALTNVRRHAGTRRVRLVLRRHDGGVRLNIRDWGRGFDPSQVQTGPGPGERVGLLGMRERIGLLGGGCIIRSRPGTGTRIVVDVPLTETGG
jgi:signal transduction histidine kinase